MNQYTTIILSLLVVVFIFYNQLRVRPVRAEKFTLPLVMLMLGLYAFKSKYNPHTFTATSWISIIISFSVLAVGMAGVRAHTVKLWQDNGVVYRKGTWVTIALWAVSIALHLILNQLGHVGQSTSLIYFSITFTVQKLIVQNRAKLIVS